MNGYPRLRLKDEQFADQCYWGQDFEPLDMSAEEFALKFPHMNRVKAIECALRLTPRQAVGVVDHLLQGIPSQATNLMTWPIYGYGALFSDDLGYVPEFPVKTTVIGMVDSIYIGLPKHKGPNSRYGDLTKRFYQGHVEHLVNSLTKSADMRALIILQDRNMVDPWFYRFSLDYVFGLIDGVVTPKKDDQYKQPRINRGFPWPIEKHNVAKLVDLGVLIPTGDFYEYTLPVRMLASDCLVRGYLSSAEGETRTRRTWAEPLTYHLTRNKEN